MFYKNIIKLISGTTLSQLLPFIVLPFLTSSMGAVEFGVFSIFFTTYIFIGTLASLRYDYAINASKNKIELDVLCFLSLIVNSVTSTITLIIVFLLWFSEVLDAKWFFLPFASFLFCLNQIQYMRANYSSLYSTMSWSKVINASVCSSVQFILVYLLGYNFGAYFGLIMGSLLSSFYLFYKDSPFNFRYSKRRVFYILYKYKSYPRYVFPGTLLNFLSGNAPMYAIAMIFGAVHAGYYSLATRIAGVPTTMIGRSMGEVFRQSAIAEYKEHSNFKKSFRKIILLSIYLSVAGFSALFFFSEPLIIMYFGDGWIHVADYLKILMPIFLLQFISSTVSYSLMISEHQRQELLWQVSRVFIIFSLILASFYLSLNVNQFLCLMMVGFSLSFLFYLYLCFMSSMGTSK